ncbi:MAG TPA: NAD(P)-dependent oxidoreductase [Propionibacteriaceae bacterium]
MSGQRRRVLVTGATGVVASQLLPALRAAYDLRLVDVRDTDPAGQAVTGVEVTDLLEADQSRLIELFAGVDTVVHCAYSRPEGEPTYAEERRNVDLMQRVYEIAAQSGVRRVVAASTNQASRWYEQPWFAGRIDRVGPEDYPRPDNFYGWAKAAYESLGFLYACGSLGPKLEVVQLRIVVPREVSAADFEDRPLHRYLRDIAGYLSERDLQQLFVKSIEAESVDDRYGVPFQIFYGVSNNARSFWSITNAREVIGYQPVDDSETRFAADIAKMIARG